jgi:hypothetical protein
MLSKIARVRATMTLALGIGLTLSFALMSPAQAQTFNVLFNFAGNGSNGAAFWPYNGLTMTAGGNFYGTTLKACRLGLGTESAVRIPGRH